MMLAKWKPTLMLLMVVLAVTIGAGAWRHAATAGQAEEPQQEKSVDAPRDKPKVPVAPTAERNYQIDLRLTRVKDGQRKVLAIPQLLTLEGRQACFAIGEDYVFSWGEGEFESVTVGPAVRLVVRSTKGNQISVDMTASDSRRGFEPGKEFSVETKSVRLIRKVELGQPFTANLKTDEKDQAELEVTAAVTMAEANRTIEVAEKKFQMAEFWRRTGHPESACFYYNLIRVFYPDTIYAKRALERFSELRPPHGYRWEPTLPQQDNEKQPPRVGQLFIIGNKTVSQKSILKQVPLFPGQVLEPADLRIAERNLFRLKTLKSAKITVLNPEEEAAYKDIRIDVEEK